MATCKRVRIKATTKVICRDKSGKVVKNPRSSKMVCPKTWRGKKVFKTGGGKATAHLTKGMCYVKTKSGGRRFVKKVRGTSSRA